MLLKSSKAFAYTPRTPTAPAPPAGADKPRPVPIDILNPDSPKKAFAALLADELAANDSRFKSSQASQALSPIRQLFPTLAMLEGLELASTGRAGGARQAG